jgi:hypothetical protein
MPRPPITLLMPPRSGFPRDPSVIPVRYGVGLATTGLRLFCDFKRVSNNRFLCQKVFLNENQSMGVGKRKAVKDEEKEMEIPKEYDRDFEYFSDRYDELCLKHKNEFVAIKDLQVYSAKDPLKLLETLNENNIDPRYAVIEFMKYR